jgi:hypothetical protein
MRAGAKPPRQALSTLKLQDLYGLKEIGLMNNGWVIRVMSPGEKNPM